jgi:hypothetical protein
MKFDCGPAYEKKVWHKWFAWHPVRLGSHDCRWLETLERKGEFHCGFGATYWIFEYRPLTTL